MERKVSGTRAIGLIAALILSLPAHAGGGGMTGGATEMTQLANNAELVAQVGEAVQTTSNTLMTAQATMQQLRQLAPSTLEKMSGLPIDQVEKLAQAYQIMSNASGAYDDAAQVLRQAQYDAQRLGISPSELLRLKAQAAQQHGGIYKQTYEQEQAKLRRLADVSRDVQQQAGVVKGIDSNVAGLQMIASQNVKIQELLITLNDSIQTANSNAAREAEKRKGDADVRGREMSDYARRHEERDGKLKEGLSNMAIQSPTEVKMFK